MELSPHRVQFKLKHRLLTISRIFTKVLHAFICTCVYIIGMSFVLKYFDIFEGLNKTALHQCIDLLCATNACVTYIILQLLENADCCFASYYAFMIDAYLNDTGL